MKPRHAPLDSILADSSAWVRVDTSRRTPNCWRPQRRPPCEGFFLTELAVEMPFASTRRNDRVYNPDGAGMRPDFSTRVAWTFGFMGTPGGGPSSYGGALSFAGEEWLESIVPITLEARYRRWIGQSASANAALGYRRTQLWRAGTGLVGAQGATAMLGFTLNQYMGVSVRGELMRGGGRTARSALVGINSTRGSEFFLKTVAIGLVRLVLGKIGIHVGDEDE